jgi:hypothetical protein
MVFHDVALEEFLLCVLKEAKLAGSKHSRHAVECTSLRAKLTASRLCWLTTQWLQCNCYVLDTIRLLPPAAEA